METSLEKVLAQLIRIEVALVRMHTTLLKINVLSIKNDSRKVVDAIKSAKKTLVKKLDEVKRS